MGLEQELDELLLEGEYPAIDASDLVRGIKDSLSMRFSDLTTPEVLAT